MEAAKKRMAFSVNAPWRELQNNFQKNFPEIFFYFVYKPRNITEFCFDRSLQ